MTCETFSIQRCSELLLQWYGFCIVHFALARITIVLKLFELEPLHTAPEKAAQLKLCTYTKDNCLGISIIICRLSVKLYCFNVFNGQ